MNKAMRNEASRPPLTIALSDLERLESLADTLPSAEEAMRAGLMEELARANVVPREEVPPNIVAMNSMVRFRLDGREMVMTLSYPSRAIDSATQLSIFTPVGCALLGLEEGASIRWPAPGGGSIEVAVIEVLHQGD